MRKTKELNETTAHLKIVSERQRTLSFQCSSHCDVFYISRREEHQKGEKRKECNSTETFSGRLVEMVWKIMSQICQKVKSFTILEKWNFFDLKQRRHCRASKGKVVNKNHETVVV